MSSPRAKSPDYKRKDFNRTQKPGASSKPWWESSAEDDLVSKDGIQSWFKTSTVQEEDENLEDEHLKTNKESPKTLGKANQHEQDLGVSVTMSKDSLDDAGEFGHNYKHVLYLLGVATGTGFIGFRQKFRPDLPNLKQDILG